MITSGDFLAGGGGVTEAMDKISCMDVKWVLNHDPVAIRTNVFNHKNVKHYWADIYKQDEHKVDPVDFVWASIECTQHSKANGGREKRIGSYTLGWELVRYIKHLLPYMIGIENVPEFRDWAPVDKNGKIIKEKKGEEFKKWVKTICALGYDYSEKIMNAADYGIPTRRERYFAFFTRKELGLSINWPKQTHSKTGGNGLKKWVACKDYIDLSDEGNSIFGRSVNPEIPKGKRKPLSENTLKRIAGGIKKFAPDLAFVLHYYSNGNQFQSVDKPLNTITTNDRHALITIEKAQFIADYYSRDNTAHSLDGPANTIRTENSKHIISCKGLVQHYSGDHSSKITDPLPTITTVDHNAIISGEAKFVTDHCHMPVYNQDNEPLSPILTWQTKQFISVQYNSNGNPEPNNHNITEPLAPVTTRPKHQMITNEYGQGNTEKAEDPDNSIIIGEKIQFISAYFSSNGNQGTQNQSIDNLLGAISTGTNKQALVTAIEKGLFDFDIKMRFLHPEELSQISTFPKKYFTDPRLKLNKKEQTKLIGNAVPPLWAKKIIQPNVEELDKILNQKQIAI